MTLTPISAAAALNSHQNASSSVIEVRCPAMISECFFGRAARGSKESANSPAAARFRAKILSAGLDHQLRLH